MYRVLEIASHADIELEVKIHYIIERIQDDAFNKSILYSTRTIRELRVKLVQYEHMRSSSVQNKKILHLTQKFQQIKAEKKAKEASGNQLKNKQQKRFYNSGKKNHIGADCPLRNKGIKCFQYGQFGHIAAKYI